jgi:hypothetical protein
MSSAVLMTQVNYPSCFSLRIKTLGSLGEIPMSPPRFFKFSRLEPCLQVGSLDFRGTTNLHRGRKVISSNGGHYKQQTLVSKALDTLSIIELLLAAAQLSVGAKFELSCCVYRAW